MGRRSDHSREELYEMALTAAREIVEKEGLRGLTARRIAKRIGYSVGTLYNLFKNLDDLVFHLRGETLNALYQALCGERLDDEPEAALRALAERYMGFVNEHPNLWKVVLEVRLPEKEGVQDWYDEKVMRLLGLVETALAPLFPPGREAERLHSARVLWAGVQGIGSLASAGAVADSASAMADTLVANYIAGLRKGGLRSTG